MKANNFFKIAIFLFALSPFVPNSYSKIVLEMGSCSGGDMTMYGHAKGLKCWYISKTKYVGPNEKRTFEGTKKGCYYYILGALDAFVIDNVPEKGDGYTTTVRCEQPKVWCNCKIKTVKK